MAEPVSVETLLQSLTEVKLSKALPVLKQLESLGGVALLPMFKGMLEGDLYFVKSSKEVVMISTIKGELTAQGVLSKQPLPGVSKNQA